MKDLVFNECVAIIMPAYNCSSTLERAVESVINQTYQNWKLYLINDKSQEDLSVILSKYTHNAKIEIVENEENLGAAKSRNVGLKLGKEKLVAFLDSDDSWIPEKLEIQVETLKNGGGISITDYFYVAKNRNPIVWGNDKLTKDDFIKKRFRVCFSSLLHKRVEGLYFESIGHEDFVYIYRLMEQFGDISVVHRMLVEYYEMDDSLSSHKKKAAKWHFSILKDINPNPVFVLCNFFYYVINGVKFKMTNR